MQQSIVPIARSIYLCDYHFSSDKSKDDLYGICNAIRVPRFPHRVKQLCVFTQLSNGLGKVKLHLDVRHDNTGMLVQVTNQFLVNFPNRRTVTKVVVNLEGFVFPESGLYSFELFCDNTWVADTVLDADYERKK